MSTLHLANSNPFSGLDEIVTENEPLAPHTWFGIGGPARYFAVARRPKPQENAALSRSCPPTRTP